MVALSKAGSIGYLHTYGTGDTYSTGDTFVVEGTWEERERDGGVFINRQLHGDGEVGWRWERGERGNRVYYLTIVPTCYDLDKLAAVRDSAIVVAILHTRVRSTTTPEGWW